MKSKYLNSVLILALFTMVITLSAFFSISEAAEFADASINSENADTMYEGVSVKSTLTSGNNFMTAYKIKPSKSGWHLFFVSGSVKEVKGMLYEGIGDTGSLESSRYEYDDEGHLYFSYNLTAGNEYTFLIQSTVESEDSVFDAGYIYTDTDEDVFLASASEITLTDAMIDKLISKHTTLEEINANLSVTGIREIVNVMNDETTRTFITNQLVDIPDYQNLYELNRNPQMFASCPLNLQFLTDEGHHASKNPFV